MSESMHDQIVGRMLKMYTARAFPLEVFILLFLTAAATAAATVQLVTAQGIRPSAPIGCENLPYCGYLEAHANQSGAVSYSSVVNGPPACGESPICGYLVAHSAGAAVSSAAGPLIPVTGLGLSLSGCGSLLYCGYLQAHTAMNGAGASTPYSYSPVLLPDCQSQPICGYLSAHTR